jgi:hypothetical protein
MECFPHERQNVAFNSASISTSYLWREHKELSVNQTWALELLSTTKHAGIEKQMSEVLFVISTCGASARFMLTGTLISAR